MLRDPPARGSIFTHHEEPSKPRRLPPAPARDLARQPRLPVERHEGGLDVRHHRPHFDDEQRRGRPAEREDVNRSAFTPDRERDFRRNLPADGREPSHDRLHQRSVRLVEQPVERLAVPQQSALHSGAERLGDRVEHPHRQPICPAPFDARDGCPGDARLPGEVDLSPPAPSPQRPNRKPEPNHIHGGKHAPDPFTRAYRGLTGLPPRESSGATAAGAGIRPRQGTAARQVLPQGHHAGVRHAFARQVSPEARHAGVRHADTVT